MAEIESIVRRRTWTPAAVGSDESTSVFSVAKGERLLYGQITPQINAAVGATPAITIGDAAGAASLMASKTLTLAASPAGAAIDMAALAAHGKIYTAADTIKVGYTAGATPGATTPRVLIEVVTVKIGRY